MRMVISKFLTEISQLNVKCLAMNPACALSLILEAHDDHRVQRESTGVM